MEVFQYESDVLDEEVVEEDYGINGNERRRWQKVYYRFKKAKRCRLQCRASIHLLYHADSDQVTVYEIELEDEHYDSGIRGIDENVKKYKEDLFDNDIKKPKLIFRAFQSTKINVPKFAQ
ncbi:unnamed protein product, partial [Rotaria sp. Silwood2]